MQTETPPVCFKPTHDVLTGIRFPTIEHAVAYGVGMEISCFLAAMGFGETAGLAKVFELVPDIEDVVLRRDRTTIVVTWDGQAIRLFRSDDDARLSEIEHNATDAGHSLFGIVPANLRNWLEGNGYARH